MDLDLVFGVTSPTIQSLAFDQVSGYVVYPASGVLVIFNPKIKCQIGYLHVRRNTITCACFSSDGKYIATGEIGHKPAVRIWRTQDASELATLYGHEFGIKSVLFSPKVDLIVSVGLEHDNVVNLWAWPSKHRVATNNIKDTICSAAYSCCGKYFVTVGVRHVKFWYPQLTGILMGVHTMPAVLPLYGRAGILRRYKDNTFVDVCCGTKSTANLVYAVTKSGNLMIIAADTRFLFAVRMPPKNKMTSITVQDRLLFIGFDSGYIQLFESKKLEYLATFPNPVFSNVNFSGVTTLVFDYVHLWLTAIYDKTNICIWELQDEDNIKQIYLTENHRKGITGLELVPERESKGSPKDIAVTASEDMTISLSTFIGSGDVNNIGSRIVVLGEQSRQTTECITAVCICYGNQKGSRYQFEVVTGNRAGTIRVYNGNTFKHRLTLNAHNKDVTVLAFFNDSIISRRFLFSGSRDRLIHVVDVNQNYNLIQTLDIHSSSITSINIYEVKGMFYMMSAAIDRSINMCCAPSLHDTVHDSLTPPDNILHLLKCAVLVSSPGDTAINKVHNEVLLACHDGYIRVLRLNTLQPRRIFKGCYAEEAQINRIAIDQKGILLATAATDRTLAIINCRNGAILITLFGHCKVVTGIAFTSSDDHLLTSAKDGCLFVWRLSDKLKASRDEAAKSHAPHNEESEVGRVDAAGFFLDYSTNSISHLPVVRRYSVANVDIIDPKASSCFGGKRQYMENLRKISAEETKPQTSQSQPNQSGSNDKESKPIGKTLLSIIRLNMTNEYHNKTQRSHPKRDDHQ